MIACRIPDPLILSRTSSAKWLARVGNRIPSRRSRPRIVFPQSDPLGVERTSRGQKHAPVLAFLRLDQDLTEGVHAYQFGDARASLRSFLFRKPAFNAAAACFASMHTAGWP